MDILIYLLIGILINQLFKNRFYYICDNKLAHVKILYFIYDIVINSRKIGMNNLWNTVLRFS